MRSVLALFSMMFIWAGGLIVTDKPQVAVIFLAVGTLAGLIAAITPDKQPQGIGYRRPRR